MHEQDPRPTSEALGDALERICFLEWRLEQLEAALADAREKNRQLRSELSESSRHLADADARQASLTDRLTEARREVEALEERVALAERGRSSAERHARELQTRVLSQARDDAARVERERQRAQVSARALGDARARLDGLERAQARFFVRLEEWQRLLGTDPDRVDLAEFIAELRGEVERLSQEGEKARVREQRLRLALVEAGGRVPEDAALERPLDAGQAARAGATPVGHRAVLAACEGAAAAIAQSAQAGAPAAAGPRGAVPPDPDRAEPSAPRAGAAAPRGTGAFDDAAGREARAAAADDRPTEAIDRRAAPLNDAVVAEPARDGAAQDPLRAAVKARLTRMSEGDDEAALSTLPRALRDRAAPLLDEIRAGPTDRALAAARVLARIAPDVAVVPAVQRLRESDTPAEWLRVLAACPTPLARAAAARHVDDPDVGVRIAALEATLAASPDGEARPALEAALADSDPRVRRRAALAAHQILGAAARDLITPLLEDPSPQTRRLAVALLGGRAPPRRAALATATSTSGRRTAWST